MLAEYTYSRNDEAPGPRTKCWPVINDITANEDRVTGNRNAAWDARNYMKDADKIKAAVLIAHGGNDFNVMTKNAAQLYAKLKANNVPHQFYFHQGGHGGSPPDAMLNRWFTKYLYGVDNGVQNEPKSWVVREAATCPPRQSTVTTEATNSATLTVADASPFAVGTTLTIPQTNANGTITSTTRVINNIAGNTLTLASAVATTAGQRVVSGAVVNLVCGTANPTPYAEWPDPAAGNAVMKLLPGGNTRGNLTLGAGGGTPETLTDDATIADTTLMGAATSPNRLVYQTNALTQDVRISGSPRVTIKASFSKPRANLSAALISYPATGTGTILTRGWMDPENRNSDYVSDPVVPGTFYTMSFDMQAKDAIVQAGRRLALMVFSSDRQYTIRPAAGTQVSLDLAGSSITIPVVGGPSAFAAATGTGYAEAPVGGAVPATLSLTLGAAAGFGPFTPGLAKDYTATTTATVISTAGDATLSVADPATTNTGKLVNGTFALPQTLQARARTGAFAPVGGSAAPTSLLTYSAPVSNDAVPIEFKQSIGTDRRAPHGVVQQDADVHPVDDDALVTDWRVRWNLPVGPPSTSDRAASRTNRNRITAPAISAASRKIAADHPPVASRKAPLTAGESTAPISPIRLFMPNAAPWCSGAAMSASIACAIGCIALKNVLAENSSAAITQTFAPPPATTKPKISVSTHCAAVKPTTSGLRPIPRRTATSESQPPTGKPRMPAPALNAAIIAERPNDDPAASATIETDQNEKNHRFQSTAMNAMLISTRSRSRSTTPTSPVRRVNTKPTSTSARATSRTAIHSSDSPAASPTK